MGTQILIGFCLVIVSIVIQVCFMEVAIRTLKKIFGSPEQAQPRFSRFVLTLSGISFWLLVSVSVIVLMWSVALIGLSVFATWEESVYFSLVAFTTLGFGDVVLPKEWRLLSGFIAANGFLIFGMITAILIEVMVRLRDDT